MDAHSTPLAASEQQLRKTALLPRAEVPEGEVRRVELAGRPPIAIYQVDGCFYATDDTCTHGTASLSEGEVEDGQIICPFHAGAFDIRTGEPTLRPCVKALRTHQVLVEDGVIYLAEGENE